jgi:methyl halide transferase
MLTASRPIENHGTGWSDLWDQGESGLWDRGKTSPALVDLIEKERDLLNPYTSDGRRKKAFVPVSITPIFL